MGGFAQDPATNRSCSYPEGVSGGKSAWNCTCMEEGNQTDTTSHAVNPGGCFDYADDDPLFKSIHGARPYKTKSSLMIFAALQVFRRVLLVLVIEPDRSVPSLED